MNGLRVKAGVVIAVCLAACCLFPAARAGADVAPRWTDAQLLALSDVVVTGRVEHVAVAMDDRSGAPYTYVTLAVDRVLKGSVRDRRVIVKQLGGRLGATALDIAGQPAFVAGEDVLLFLEVRPRDGTLATTAQWQGKFTIARSASGATAVRDDPSAAARGAFSTDVRPLDGWLQALDRQQADGAQAGSAPAIEVAPQDAAARVTVSGRAAPGRPAWRLGAAAAAAGQAIRVDAAQPGQAGLADGGEGQIRHAAEFWSRTGLLPLAAGGLQPAGCVMAHPADGRIVVGVDGCGELGTRGGTLAISGGWVRYDTSGVMAAPAFESAFVMTNGAASATQLLAKPSCFEAVVTHELGHAIGLGHAIDDAAPMGAFLQCDAGFGTIVSPGGDRARAGISAASIAAAGIRPMLRPLQATTPVEDFTGFQRVSIKSNGTEGNAASAAPALSGDARCIAFQSDASTLVSDDTNVATDIFVFDRLSGLTTRESVASDGTQANGPSRAPAIGGTCRYVVFASDASNLVTGVSGTQIYVRDRTAGTTVLASASSAGVAGDGASGQPTISSDGRIVAFWSNATNLVSGDSNGIADIFTRDLANATTARESVASDGTQATGSGTAPVSSSPVLSSDGRFVAFDSEATNLVAVDAGGRDVFVHDRSTGTTTLVSVGTTGAQLGGQAPSISADGRYVAFSRSSPVEIYVRDRTTGSTAGVFQTSLAQPVALLPRLSADGRYLTFSYFTGAGLSVRLHDLSTGTVNTVAAGDAVTPVASGTVALSSTSALTVEDMNGVSDIFIVSIASGGVPGPPTNLTYTLNGSTLTLSWTAPVTGAPPTNYRIQAGSSSGGVDIADFLTGTTATTFSAIVGGSGVFYIRVLAVNAAGTSPPSNEIIVTVGGAASPSGAPSGLTASVNGTTVTLTWSAPATGGPVSSYVIEAGSSSGAANLANVDTGTTATSFVAAGVGGGTYFVRVRAKNAGGTGPASNEVVVIVASSCVTPGAPSNLSGAVAGSNVTLTWTAGAGATSYLLLVGSNPGQSNILVQDLRSAATSLNATGVGAGSYFVRVRSLTACAQSGDSNEVLIIVR